MKWNRLIAFFVIFGATILLLLPAVLAENLPVEESKIIEDEAITFSQILILYATAALEKPSDLRLCAYEMFRLKPNENSCRDKHSSWLSKEDSELLKSDTEGKFGGVGLENSEKDGKVVVVAPH